jgi:hypothetical protein
VVADGLKASLSQGGLVILKGTYLSCCSGLGGGYLPLETLPLETCLQKRTGPACGRARVGLQPNCNKESFKDKLFEPPPQPPRMLVYGIAGSVAIFESFSLVTENSAGLNFFRYAEWRC